jgi:hypothetical protein
MDHRECDSSEGSTTHETDDDPIATMANKLSRRQKGTNLALINLAGPPTKDAKTKSFIKNM